MEKIKLLYTIWKNFKFFWLFSSATYTIPLYYASFQNYVWSRVLNLLNFLTWLVKKKSCISFYQLKFSIASMISEERRYSSYTSIVSYTADCQWQKHIFSIMLIMFEKNWHCDTVGVNHCSKCLYPQQKTWSTSSTPQFSASTNWIITLGPSEGWFKLRLLNYRSY